MRTAKGQISIEFLIILTILFLVLIFSVWVYGVKNKEVNDYRINESAKLVAFSTATAINGAYLAGDGFESVVEMDSFGFDFNLSIEESAVTVSWDGGIADYPILTDKVVLGDIAFGEMATIRTRDGNVFLG